MCTGGGKSVKHTIHYSSCSISWIPNRNREELFSCFITKQFFPQLTKLTVLTGRATKYALNSYKK